MIIDLVRETIGGAAAWFWLDGAGDTEHPVSYVGVASEVRFAERGREKEFLAGLEAPTSQPTSHYPAARLSSGWVIALGYEFGVGLMGLRPTHDAQAPAFALRADNVVEIDHRAAPLDAVTDSAADRAQTGDVVTGADFADGRWKKTAQAYETAVEDCRAAIRAGDAYVLCLTDTFRAEARERPIDPLQLYAAVRGSDPALRGGVVVAGDRALISASPERFLSIRRNPATGDRQIATHPIKGTRPRGATGLEDDALRMKLALDAKERAENLMIVDLMRNDLSRVCKPGSVTVSDFLRVETHPRVHQLVSTVEGELHNHVGVSEIITACFPGGSMTGAPKASAVEILSRLEGQPRGLYSGCFGWVNDAGEAELAMSIRGIELRNLTSARTIALIGAGGGVTAESEPTREHAEKQLKAAALLSALYS